MGPPNANSLDSITGFVTRGLQGSLSCCWKRGVLAHRFSQEGPVAPSARQNEPTIYPPSWAGELVEERDKEVLIDLVDVETLRPDLTVLKEAYVVTAYLARARVLFLRVRADEAKCVGMSPTPFWRHIART